MKNQIFLLLGMVVMLTACQQRKVMKAGQIHMELVVYNDPAGNLYDSFQLPISTLYFAGTVFLEQVPQLSAEVKLPAYALIKNQTYTPLNRLSDLEHLVESYPLDQKNFGAVFINQEVTAYANHGQLSDTTLNGQYLQRFEIITPEEYSVFYLHPTDTVLPYSLCRQFETDYSGIITRIDTYQRKQDRFLSLRMRYREGIPLRFVSYLKN